MNFDVQIHHIVNYRFVQNLQFIAITSIVNNGIYGFCRFVDNHFSSFALRTYKTFTFTTTQLVRVIHIHRFVSFVRMFETPIRAVLARPFFIVQNSINF